MKFQIKYKGKNFIIAADYKKGSDELILFIHGLGCSKESFKDALKDKRFEDFSVLILDLPGHGDSPGPKDFSYSMEEQADIVRALLNKFPYKTIHIVGHSMGGVIGLLLVKHLKNLKSFINVEGNLIAEDCGMVSRKTADTPYKKFEEKVFDELRHKVGAHKETGSRLFLKLSKKTSSAAFHRSAISLVQWSDSGKLLKMFGELPIKKAYIYGENNKKTPILRRLKNVPKIEVSKSGHFLMNDNPKEFYKIISNIINS